MMSYYYINNNFEKIDNIDYNLDWLIINYLYQVINNNKYCIKIIIFFCLLKIENLSQNLWESFSNN